MYRMYLTITRRARFLVTAPQKANAARMRVIAPLVIRMAGPVTCSFSVMKDSFWDSTCR